ncbi:MAG: translation elongation factor Ts [Gemmatimonadales bacterium]|jgi:elongation factor Ts
MTMTISAKEVAALRAKTGAGMMDCKKALEETNGDMDKAVELLRKKGIASADKRTGRSAAEGLIGSYVHFNGRVAVLVEVNCETDFVARTEDFKQLVTDISLHIASAKPLAVRGEDIPEDILASERRIAEAQATESGKPAQVQTRMVEGKLKKFVAERALLDQAFVKDDKMTIGDLVKAASGKTGENIVVKRFVRFEIGEA